MTLSQEYSKISYFFLNCDLRDRVTTGMQERTKRDAYRQSILPLYYIRNIVTIERPSLVPIEKGTLLYSINTHPKYYLYVVNEFDIGDSAGSLNRYMEQGVFRYNPKERNPTRNNQEFTAPRYHFLTEFDTMPLGEEINEQMGTYGTWLNTQYEKFLERKEKQQKQKKKDKYI